MSRGSLLFGLLAGFAVGAIVTTSLRGYHEGQQEILPRVVQNTAREAPTELMQPPPQPVATETPETQTVNPPDHFTEDPVAALQRLATTCAFWSKRASDDNGRAFRDRACREMRSYATRTGQRSPRIETVKRQPAKPSRKTDAPLPLYVRECSEHRSGSIDYRRCRARESRRLKEQCQQHRQDERWSEAAGWCAAYESYQVID